MTQLLTFDGDHWCWVGGYDTRMLPKEAGFRWDPVRRKWWTDEVKCALRLRKYADLAAEQEFRARERRDQERIQESSATEADIYVPAPEGLSYLPYQLAGIRYLASRQGALLGDEMGLGKTIQAIGLINLLPDIRRVLVICPAGVKINWARELRKWLVRPLAVGIVDGSTWSDTDVVVINYDVLDRHRSNIHAVMWDLLVVDEAHYIKNPQAKRTLAVVGQRRWDAGRKEWVWTHRPIPARRRIAMTGTPIHNRPQDLWTLVDLAMMHMPVHQRPEWFRSRSRFWGRYAGYHEGEYGWQFAGPQNLEELQRELRRTIMMRRLKSQVLTELPPKVRQVIELDSSRHAAVVRAEYEAARRKQQSMIEAQAQVAMAKASGDEQAYRAAVRSLQAAAQVAFSEMSAIRHQVGLATAEAAKDFLESAVEQEEKVVIWVHHHDVAKTVASYFEPGSYVVYMGGDSAAEKDAAVQSFQTDPRVKVFIGGITTAGVGLTLTAASHAIFVELDWLPANIQQAEDRCHRIGQPNSVLVQHLVLSESLSARMAQVLVEKMEVNDRALDRMDQVYASEPVTIADVAGDDSPASDAPQVSAAQLENDAESLSEEDVHRLHSLVRELAARCDHASRRDGYGFNRLDYLIGHRLAEVPDGDFTPRMAALAKRILRKYGEQICARIGGAAKRDFVAVYGYEVSPSEKSKGSFDEEYFLSRGL